MGYMRHHCIVVTTSMEACATRAHAKAMEIFGDQRVTGVLSTRVNGYLTFFVGPDGSKEGWSESDEGDMAREAFMAWLRTQEYGDGSSPFDWVELQYGDEDGKDQILRGSFEPIKAREGPTSDEGDGAGAAPDALT